MSKRLIFFAGLCACVLACACNESVTGKRAPLPAPDAAPECKTECISGTVLGECVDGDTIERDCAVDGKICADASCIDDPNTEPACTKSHCIGDILYACVNSEYSPRDCTLEGKICDDGDCVEATIEPLCDQTSCKSGTVLVQCNDGQPTEIDCTLSGQICEEDKCVTPPQCTKDVCASETLLNKCEGGVIVPYNCADDNMICDDDACTLPDTPLCSDDVCDQNGLLLYKCNDGEIEIINCADNDQICSEGKCADFSCETDFQDCSGNTLYACKDGNFTLTDCTKSEQVCDSLLRECVYECETETYFANCTAPQMTRQCVNHHITEIPCGETDKCTEGRCVEDGCLKCTETQYCLDGECLDNQPQQWLGMPCECWGEDCYITISGFEFKHIFKGLALIVVDSLINDDDMIQAPNFFSPSNRGCEALEAVVPEGMSVGCFREGILEFPSSIMTLMGKVPGVLQAVNSNSELVTKLLPVAVEIMQGGLHFTSPNGYCMTATIDIEGTIDSKTSISKLVNKNAFKKSNDPENPNLVDHFNTGNHKTVLTASAEAGDSYCPENGVLFSYTIQKAFASVGSFDVGFDMCLKSCATNEDCRTDYECVDIPTKASLNGTSETQKACFDKRNVDNIGEMIKRIREGLNSEEEETNEGGGE